MISRDSIDSLDPVNNVTSFQNGSGVYPSPHQARNNNSTMISTAFTSKASLGQRVTTEVRDLKGQIETLLKDSERKDHRVEGLMKEIQSLRAMRTNHQVRRIYLYRCTFEYTLITYIISLHLA